MEFKRVISELQTEIMTGKGPKGEKIGAAIRSTFDVSGNQVDLTKMPEWKNMINRIVKKLKQAGLIDEFKSFDNSELDIKGMQNPNAKIKLRSDSGKDYVFIPGKDPEKDVIKPA